MIGVEHGYIPVGYNIVARKRDTYTYTLNQSGAASSKTFDISGFSSITDIRGQNIPHVTNGKSTFGDHYEFTTHSTSFDGTYETFSQTSVLDADYYATTGIRRYYRHYISGDQEGDNRYTYSYGTPWQFDVGWGEIRWNVSLGTYLATVYLDTTYVNGDSSVETLYDSTISHVVLSDLPDKTISHNLYTITKSVSTETNPTTI